MTEYLIWIHAGLGGLALLSGGVALISRKGLTAHKSAGKVFFYSMLLSALVALVVSMLPGHTNPFLFSIGLFSSYFIVTGYRALRFKQREVNLGMDKFLAWFILLVGVSMILYPLIALSKLNIVLTVFGLISLAFGIRDLSNYRNPERLRKKRLKQHLSKMCGGYIAAVTAFLVVNQVLPGIWNWFIPTVIGTAYITFWMRKLGPKQSKSSLR